MAEALEYVALIVTRSVAAQAALIRYIHRSRQLQHLGKLVVGREIKEVFVQFAIRQDSILVVLCISKLKVSFVCCAIHQEAIVAQNRVLQECIGVVFGGYPRCGLAKVGRCRIKCIPLINLQVGIELGTPGSIFTGRIDEVRSGTGS